MTGALDRARKRNIHVIDKGEGRFKVMAVCEVDPKKQASQAEVDAVTAEVQGILSKAANSDDSAAKALRGLVDLAQVGFSSAPVIADRDRAGAVIRREQIRQRGIKLAADYRKNTKWPFEWGPDGTHPRGRAAESDQQGVHWAERDLLKQRPWEAAKWADITYWAKKTAEREHLKNPNIDENAFRHTIWQARLTYELGSEGAERWADAHEAYYPKSERDDHMADLVNNENGRNLGRQAKERIPFEAPPRGVPNYRSPVEQYILNEARRYAQSDQAATRHHFADR
ncbi:hypothetical protein ABT174_36835 [Streptomyces sparsogenes]|uniref:DUF6973 domain-containing protein n=1 Tax=Streptomyces sparsogenes TaxID=67365 RepID=UPI003323F696